MMKLLNVLLAFLALASPAEAQLTASVLSRNTAPVPAQEKLFASHAAFLNSSFSSGGWITMAKTTHTADRACSVVRLWFFNGLATVLETGVTSTRTVRASVQYPAGTTPQRVTFSQFASAGDITTGVMGASPAGALSSTSSPSALIYSDPLRLTTAIPAGGLFEERNYQTGASELYTGMYGSTTLDWSLGATQVAGLTDETGTTGNHVSALGGSGYVPPAAITCVSGDYGPSLTWFGDSLTVGINSSVLVNGTNQYGIIASSSPPSMPFIQIGQQGSGTSVGVNDNWSQAPYRRLLYPYSTNYFMELGTNDIMGSVSAATLEQRVVTYAQYVPVGAHTFIMSVSPKSTSANGLYTSDQVSQHAVELNCYNGTLRQSSPAGCTGSQTPLVGLSWGRLVDVASLYEATPGAGVWITTQVRHVTDASSVSGTQAISTPTGAFTSADIGWGINCLGMANAGGVYHGIIVSLDAATPTLKVNVNSPVGNSIATTVAGTGTCEIQAPTLDGVHPVNAIYKAGSALMNWQLAQ